MRESDKDIDEKIYGFDSSVALPQFDDAETTINLTKSKIDRLLTRKLLIKPLYDIR